MSVQAHHTSTTQPRPCGKTTQQRLLHSHDHVSSAVVKKGLVGRTMMINMITSCRGGRVRGKRRMQKRKLLLEKEKKNDDEEQMSEAANFWKEAAGTAELRRTMLPLRFFSRPKTGGRLHVATHAYYYQGGLEERDARRHALDGSPEWQNYQYRTKGFISEQRSNIYVEAPFVREQVFPQVKGLVRNPDTTATASDTANGDNSHDIAVLELRRYQLQLGYDTVPKFLDLYTAGLPSKLEAPGTDLTTSLVTVLYTEIGQLNEVWEIWHHGHGHAAMDASRRAALSLGKEVPYRQSLGEIQGVIWDRGSIAERMPEMSS
eukprot:scaffold1987_cov145-Amphora_coffeaeformis.AAC.5